MGSLWAHMGTIGCIGLFFSQHPKNFGVKQLQITSIPAIIATTTCDHLIMNELQTMSRSPVAMGQTPLIAVRPIETLPSLATVPRWQMDYRLTAIAAAIATPTPSQNLASTFHWPQQLGNNQTSENRTARRYISLLTTRVIVDNHNHLFAEIMQRLFP